MKEIYGDLFKFANSKEYTHCMITTNGTIKANGLAVMGRGCAYEMAQRFTGTSKTLANNIIKFGNVPSFLSINNDVEYWSFPVKHNWWEQADIELIKKSIELFKKDLRFDSKVLLPRPGCGNGGLNWIDVKQIIEHFTTMKMLTWLQIALILLMVKMNIQCLQKQGKYLQYKNSMKS